MQASRHKKILLPLLLIAVSVYACAHRSGNLQHRSARYLTAERQVWMPQGLEPREIITTAKTYLGTPYHFGGRYREGTDCSGFTQMVFKKHGVRLPHSARSQAQLGHYIDRVEDLRPADLVFFETYRKGPSHVGIYLGHKRFIHASTSEQKVVIASMEIDYYVKRFLGGKRLLRL